MGGGSGLVVVPAKLHEYARNNGDPFTDRHCPCAQWLSKMTAFGVPRTVLAGENGARRLDDRPLSLSRRFFLFN